MRLATLALLASILAGCVSAPADTQGGEATAFVDPILEDHDHSVLADHALQTSTMELLGYASLGDASTKFTSLGELDIFPRADGTLVATVSAQVVGGSGAVVLVDVTDPASMTRLGFVTLPEGAHPLDVKWDEKGEYVYASATGRLFVVDARDATKPALAGAALSTGVACHMTAMGTIQSQEYLFCTGDGLWMTVYQVVVAADKRSLVPVGQWKPSDPPRGTGPSALGAPHDMTFQLDPVDEKPILAVSGRGFGLRVLDVSDPKSPKEMAKWTGEGADHPPIHMHTGMVAVIDGTRYLIGSPEILPNAQTPPAVWVLDATDYGALKLVAEWTAPGDHGSPGFTFTTHQWQIADGRIYLGYYHAGVWVLDVRAILAGGYRDDPARPEVLGYYLPNMEPATPGAMVPNVWDVNLWRGVAYATDISSGVYALHYAPDRIGDEALTGFS